MTHQQDFFRGIHWFRVATQAPFQGCSLVFDTHSFLNELFPILFHCRELSLLNLHIFSKNGKVRVFQGKLCN